MIKPPKIPQASMAVPKINVCIHCASPVSWEWHSEGLSNGNVGSSLIVSTNPVM